MAHPSWHPREKAKGTLQKQEECPESAALPIREGGQEEVGPPTDDRIREENPTAEEIATTRKRRKNV